MSNPIVITNGRNTCTLYHADCLDVLPTLTGIECVVTSPPYNLVKENSGGSTTTFHSHESRFGEWYEDEIPEDAYQDWQKRVLRACMQACKGSVFYNHKVRYAWSRRGSVYHPMDWLREFPLWCEIIWDRCGVQGVNVPRFPCQDERIYQLGKPIVWNKTASTTIWRFPPENSSALGHVCAFPVELASRCIVSCTSEGHTAADPFMGSGTTGIACLRTGRNFVGIEKDARYFEIARDRIEREARQGILL